jgi:hypothetical protein
MQRVSRALTYPRFSMRQSTFVHGPHPITEGQMVDVILARDVSTLRKPFMI